MQLSPLGLNLIRQFEGFRNHAYLDIAGIPTIGYGHRIQPGESFPDGLTEAQAAQLLAADADIAASAVTRHVKVPLTQGQFDALVDFVYNLGVARFAASTLLSALNALSYDAAASQLLRWDHAGSIEVEGLKRRRQAEFALWNSVKSAVAPS